ncbi:hypothetical protein A2U01_0072004, partial [Trifolium medium]|nr:hypothetical protein [Trifolium medium]
NLTKLHSRHSNLLDRNLCPVVVPVVGDDVCVVQVSDDAPVPSSIDTLVPSRSEDAYANLPSTTTKLLWSVGQKQTLNGKKTDATRYLASA